MEKDEGGKRVGEAVGEWRTGEAGIREVGEALGRWGGDSENDYREVWESDDDGEIKGGIEGERSIG